MAFLKKQLLFISILAVAGLFFSMPIAAADRYWVGADTGATANWNTINSWSATSGGDSGGGTEHSSYPQVGGLDLLSE